MYYYHTNDEIDEIGEGLIRKYNSIFQIRMRQLFLGMILKQFGNYWLTEITRQFKIEKDICFLI